MDNFEAGDSYKKDSSKIFGSIFLKYFGSRLKICRIHSKHICEDDYPWILLKELPNFVYHYQNAKIYSTSIQYIWSAEQKQNKDDIINNETISWKKKQTIGGFINQGRTILDTFFFRLPRSPDALQVRFKYSRYLLGRTSSGWPWTELFIFTSALNKQTWYLITLFQVATSLQETSAQVLEKYDCLKIICCLKIV